jgi:hypothetical protein
MSSVLDPEGLFSVREVSRMREIDDDIEEALNITSPQALLRDLHRAVKSFGVNPFDFDKHERIIDGGFGAVADVKSIIFASYRIPIVELLPTRAMYADGIAERREIMTAPWADAPKFGTQYLPRGMTIW